MNIGLISTPVIAGFIGCITNALAIKMLFSGLLKLLKP